jgi:hypothetical protein
MVGGGVRTAVASSGGVRAEDQESSDKQDNDTQHDEYQDAAAALGAFAVRVFRFGHGGWMRSTLWVCLPNLQLLDRPMRWVSSAERPKALVDGARLEVLGKERLGLRGNRRRRLASDMA